MVSQKVELARFILGFIVSLLFCSVVFTKDLNFTKSNCSLIFSSLVSLIFLFDIKVNKLLRVLQSGADEAFWPLLLAFGFMDCFYWHVSVTSADLHVILVLNSKTPKNFPYKCIIVKSYWEMCVFKLSEDFQTVSPHWSGHIEKIWQKSIVQRWKSRSVLVLTRKWGWSHKNILLKCGKSVQQY